MTSEIKAQMPTEKILTVDNLKLAYFEQGQGPTIILLHGWPQTSYVWRKIFPELSKKYRVIAIDLPGLGNSEKSTRYDTKHIATIINDFTDSLGLKKFHLVGHDIGSWVAVPYALFFESKLISLAVLDAGIPGIIPSSLFQPEHANKIWQFYFHAIDEIPELLTEGKEKEYLSWYFTKKTFIKSAISEIDIETYYLAYKGKEKMSNGFDYYRAFCESAKQNTTVKTKLNIPVLAIGGEYAVADQVGIAMNKIAENIETKVIENCGHYIPEEQPKELINNIVKFIGRVEKASR